MKYLIYSILLLVGFNSMAQLTVRNDAFMFVNDELLFVEDYVNLTEENSTLYLRNDAQLLQGVNGTGNSGMGSLSVYQTANFNQYMFQYFGSPVGNSATSFGNSPYKVNNIQTPLSIDTSDNITFTTSPDGTDTPHSVSQRWLYNFRPVPAGTFSNWVSVAPNTDVNNGYGFTMKGVSESVSNQTYDFRGKPNDGNIEVDVLAYFFTLVGNPYPSAIDTVELIYDTDNQNAITGTLYFWEQDPANSNSHNFADYVGGYATYTINADGSMPSFVAATYNTYNSDGSINTTGPGSTSGKQVGRYLPIAQGFMVEGNPTSSGTFTFKNSHRAYYKQSDSDSEFFRTSTINDETEQTTSEGFPTIPSYTKRFRLYTDFDGVYTRELMMNFHPDATLGFDYGYEGNNPGGVTTDSFWITETNALVIQAVSFDIEHKLPVALYVNSNQDVVFSIKDVQNFDEDTPIYIHDKELDTYTDLKVEDYTINLDIGYYGERFEIVFLNQQSLNVDENTLETVGVIQNQQQKKLSVFNSRNLNINKIELFDIRGSKIVSQVVDGNNSQYDIPTSNLQTGIYVAKVSFDDNNRVFTRKIIIRN